MGKKRTNTRLIIYSIIMLFALAWLTVSLPFVNESQMLTKQLTEETGNGAGQEDNTNPLSNTTEEKTESGANSLSEYLHDIHLLEHHFTVLTTFYKCHPSDLYFAFHPELLSPPPEA